MRGREKAERDREKAKTVRERLKENKRMREK
jgi:hypothetical protein